AVFAIPSSKEEDSLISHLETYDGRGWKTHLPSLSDNRKLTSLAHDDVIDLSGQMTANGEIRWNAPKGNWTVIRLGHASNFKMTRPSPNAAVGLECDRLNQRGIEAHFEHHLKPILDGAGEKAGRTLQYIHIDSWEAHGQNWTAGFAEQFRQRRGYDIRPWLPVLTGHVVESAEETDRFLWDLRRTVSEVTLSRYVDRLRELIAPYGVQFSCEPYGRLCVDSLTYAGRSDFPISEFWTERKILKPFPTFSDYWYTSMKGLASVANTYGKSRVGAEAFTGSRGWVDHPYLIKGMGDEAFCNGVSHYVLHLSAHQPYDNMKPGLTHRRWGQHFNRHQTWWEFSKPFFDYVTRSQFLLQQGRRVVDVACLYHEGAPLNFNDIRFELPAGYDYDFCSSEIIQRMEARDGLIHLPSGVNYRYLVLPGSGKLTLPTARKIEELREAGASICLQSHITGTPGLEGYPEANDEVRQIAEEWPLLPDKSWSALFAIDELKPDFEGDDIRWIHRRTKGMDIYFLGNSKRELIKRECTFRVTGKTPELWNPETGEAFGPLSAWQTDGRTTAVLDFEPFQSWFVVFRDTPSMSHPERNPFPSWKTVQDITGTWSLSFDPGWGTKDILTIDGLRSWSEHSDPLVKYYSGIGTYRKAFDVSKAGMLNGTPRYCLDLGQVEVMAHVTLNGEDCGITWKPPYRVDITHALISGQNKLEIKVVNTWVNRMIGDEQLPTDANWKDWETLVEWPDWFKQGQPSPTGRYTFTTARHYGKDSPLQPSGLLGPVRILSGVRGGVGGGAGRPNP
ncbi:MAG: glycosyl hydrolase, partial [Planctomycetota bacterium]